MPSRFFQSFLRTEAVGGVVLLTAALAALATANSPLASAYDALWATRLVVGPESHPLALSARAWVKYGLTDATAPNAAMRRVCALVLNPMW